jgi:hypothetical protein
LACYWHHFFPISVPRGFLEMFTKLFKVQSAGGNCPHYQTADFPNILCSFYWFELPVTEICYNLPVVRSLEKVMSLLCLCPLGATVLRSIASVNATGDRQQVSVNLGTQSLVSTAHLISELFCNAARSPFSGVSCLCRLWPAMSRRGESDF